MKRIICKVLAYISVLMMPLFIATSCSDVDESVNDSNVNKPSVTVVSVGQCLGGNTRSVSNADNNLQVLNFRDSASLSQTLVQLKSMTVEQRANYFKSIGFVNAEQFLSVARKQAEDIIDIEDDAKFGKALKQFQQTYDGVLAFDETDAYNITPYLGFTDTDMEIVGNIKGYVAVDSKLITPKNKEPNINEGNVYLVGNNATLNKAPFKPTFRQFKNCQMTIRSGRHFSRLNFGRIVEGNLLTLKMVTKKKRGWWNVEVAATYSLSLGLDSKDFHHVNSVITHEKVSGSYYCSVLPIRLLGGNTFDATVKNFKSSAIQNPGESGNASFKNITII